MMEFRIADTFTASLARLNAQERKAVKTTAFDLQMDPSSPGLSLHKLDRAQDKNFWSVRVNADIRVIVHRTPASLLLAYVDHHDPAYRWAERRKIERHPTTGAMQLVEVRERIEEIPAYTSRPAEAPPRPARPKLFDNLRKVELMAFGVPAEWVDDVRAVDEDTLFDIIPHLPQEAQEALLKLAVGETPERPKQAQAGADPFAHPDAQRRFRVLTNTEALQRALDYPWEKWAVFLHPAQAALVERDFAGPARVSGSAGTGKTIVALHRAVHLARANQAARVLLTTFSDALANALRRKLTQLVGNEPALTARITVKSITRVALDLYAATFGAPHLANAQVIDDLLKAAAAGVQEKKFTAAFLRGEWQDVVDAWQLQSWDDYAQVTRLGRKTRLGGKQREALWGVFELVRASLSAQGFVTVAGVFGRLTEHLAAGASPPFDHAIVDEAQDLGVAEARFVAALGAARQNGLLLAGDLGQRIFQQPFSLRALGIDVRGRSTTLKINYRTSHQIRSHADALLPKLMADVDGNAETRTGTISVFDGPPPAVQTFASEGAEAASVASWIKARVAQGYQPDEIGVFVRSDAQMARARTAIKQAGQDSVELSDEIEATAGRVAVSTMHVAKGLEFRAVVVMACDDEVLPLQDRIETVTDDADLEEVYNTERHLLYVACTRARDHLLISGVAPASEFLRDF